MAPAAINAIIAKLDLDVVRGLRAALNDDAKLALAAHALREARFEPRVRIEPEPVIEPRVRFHPTPHFEPRAVIYPRPRVAPLTDACPPCPPPPSEDAADGKCRIEPPWKVRPWEAPLPIKREVKVVQVRPDVVSKGSLIDFFC